MITKLPEDPNEICGVLAETSRDVYDALIQGCLKVREYFDGLQHDLNAPLAANIARYHARHTITKKRNLLTPYYIEEVPNNGISLKQDLFEIKVLKGRDGEPPSPSKTKKGERFYSQDSAQIELFRGFRRPWASHEWKEFAASTDKLCLLFCWEVDASYSISRLQLMCPRQPWKYMQSAQLFWKTDVPHPLTGLVNLPNVNDNEDELEDLVIHFEETGELEN
jgi:hypothetical protein